MPEKSQEAKDVYFIDTHAHLDMIEGKTPDMVVQEALDENVKFIINVGSDVEGSLKSVEYAKTYDCVFASVGIHPHYANKFGKKEEEFLGELIKNNKVYREIAYSQLSEEELMSYQIDVDREKLKIEQKESLSGGVA